MLLTRSAHNLLAEAFSSAFSQGLQTGLCDHAQQIPTADAWISCVEGGVLHPPAKKKKGRGCGLVSTPLLC